MRITTVTVEYGVTERMGDYNNIRPSVRLTAELDGDDLGEELAWLMETARAKVHEEVDTALEAMGQPPKHDQTAGLYEWVIVRKARAIAVVPAKTKLPGGLGICHRASPMRYLATWAAARKALLAIVNGEGFEVVGCQDGNLEPLLARIPAEQGSADGPDPEELSEIEGECGTLARMQAVDRLAETEEDEEENPF
jgi:hypothetical protein